MRFVLFATVLLWAGVGAAQPAQVDGTVVDAETGEPLPGANVFLAGTTVGGSTDAAGRFAFAAPAPSEARVTATMLGYETASTPRALRPGDRLSLSFALRPVPLTLGEVAVVRERDPAWDDALVTFRAVLLGATANAAQTDLVNPEGLDLAFEDRVLRAVARRPLVVLNRALGYELTMYDLTLTASTEGRAWDGVVAFRDLCPEACAPTVGEARARAFAGSLAHYLRAAVAGRTEAEGFQSLLVSKPGAGRTALDVVRRLIGRGPPPVPSSIFETGPNGGGTLRVERALRVTYGPEADDRPGRRGRQVSWLTVEGGVLSLGPAGTLLNQPDVTRYGYWDWERVADLLPTDYVPGAAP